MRALLGVLLDHLPYDPLGGKLEAETVPPLSLLPVCADTGATKLQGHHNKAALTSPGTGVYVQNTKCKEVPDGLQAGEKQV